MSVKAFRRRLVSSSELSVTQFEKNRTQITLHSHTSCFHRIRGHYEPHARRTRTNTLVLKGGSQCSHVSLTVTEPSKTDRKLEFIIIILYCVKKIYTLYFGLIYFTAFSLDCDS